MKRTIPLLITSIGGFILVASAFIPAAQGAGETVTMWFNILAAIAMVLGGANLAQVQLRIISDRKPGWGYAAIVLVSFFATLIFGLGKFGVRPDTSSQFPGEIWEPIPLSAFPTATLDLTPREQTVLAPVIDRLRAEPPASVASQIRFDSDSVAFQGWMNADQKRDLIDADEDVLWKSAAERLSDVAAVPGELQGVVLHRGDRNVFAVIRTLSTTDEAKLRDAIQSPAVDRLVIACRRETATPISPLPATFPEGLVDDDDLASEFSTVATAVEFDRELEIQNESHFVIGAVTPLQYSTLKSLQALSRPRNGLTQEAAAERADGWGLVADSRTRYVDAMTNPVDADTILLPMISAGGEKDSPRSWVDIANDVENGDPSPQLDAQINSEPDLTPAQRSSIQQFVSSHSDGFDAEVMQSFGSRQREALRAAIESLPSNATRQRDVAFELLADGSIDRQVADEMLESYRQERDESRALDTLYVRSQQPKFAYAADYAKNGSAFWWIYEYLFKPLTATMFSMLAFYISSAAFRAFRAKNLEAGLLLGTAFIVLLGRTFAGVWLTSWLPDSLAFLKIENLTVFIMSVFNTAGNRAIMIGIALGIISTSLKVLLGMDRSYLGKE